MRLNEYASTRRTRGSYKIPTSVQKSIPIDEIYADGTWRSGEVYSQMWSVSDINYAMQSDDKKQDILAKMGRIYSNIPTDCWAQLCIVRFRLFRFCLSWIYLSWIFPFRWNTLFYASCGLFMDRILNISQLSVFIAEALPGEIPVPLQLLQGGSNGIHAIPANVGQPLCGIIPIFRQRQHKGKKPLRL